MKQGHRRKISNEERELCKLRTPKFRVSYPHLFEPHAPNEGDKKKYSIVMLFPKDKKIVGEAPNLPDGSPGESRTLLRAIKNAKLAEFGPKENWPDELESPIADGDDPRFHKNGEKEGYKGHWVIKASSNQDQKPQIVGPSQDKLGRLVELTKPSDVYPGCYARAFIMAYIWYFGNKVGVGFILDGVQFLADGKPFSSKRDVNTVFSPVVADDEDEEDSDDDENF